MGSGTQGTFTPTKRRGPIAAEFQSPGPAMIALPSTIGINAQESTVKKAPAFSFGSKHEEKLESPGPGPGQYNVTKLTYKGKDEHPAPTISGRPKEMKKEITPAPGAYSPEKGEKIVAEHTPAYSFGTKLKTDRPDNIPAPNSYSLPPAIGTGVAPAFTISGKGKTQPPPLLPGPGQYDPSSPDKIKPKSPAYSLASRTHLPTDSTQKPGPGAHSPEKMSDITSKLQKFVRKKPVGIKPFVDSDEEDEYQVISGKKDSGKTEQNAVSKAIDLLKSPEKGSDDNDFIIPTSGRSQAKRMRFLSSESEPESPSKAVVLSSGNAEKCQKKVEELSAIFPEKDDLELQDVLVANDWDVERASNCLLNGSETSSIPSSNFDVASSVRSTASTASSSSPVIRNKKILGKPQKKRIKIDIESDEDEEENYMNNMDVYFSDDSDEEEMNKRKQVDQKKLEENRRTVLDFYNEGTLNMISAVPGCSKKKAESIIALRPFASWDQLVKKFKSCKLTNTEMLNKAKDVIIMQREVELLMKKCEKISVELLEIVEEITSGNGRKQLTEQPRLIPKEMRLSGYQMIGLNWLVLMHKQNLNGVLADEMGLGKTIQAISFLAYLFEQGNSGPHLIVVPASTLDNWEREIHKWMPAVEVLVYRGSQEERRVIRVDFMYGRLSNVQIVLTTYSMVVSSVDDRVLFRKMKFEYVVYDEAHMLKNMATQRFEQLMRVNAPRRLLLTGTPLQNSLVELMSLLVFVMPDMFQTQMHTLKSVFSMFPKGADQDEKTKFESERVSQAKKIMKPFFLRRLKSDVLKDLPKKKEETIRVPMAPDQQRHYDELVQRFSKQVKERGSVPLDEELENMEEETKVKSTDSTASSCGHMLMDLRKLANHPLLLRYKYTDEKVLKMGRELMKEPIHAEARLDYILEDLRTMSDFELHKTCFMYPTIKDFTLSNEELCVSGKFSELDSLLPSLQQDGSRVLIFSQFVITLDILEEYLKFRKYKYLRLDGNTPVNERQALIDEYNQDQSIFIFLLSTRAGGLGINLTAANTVILHDIDFNPHNDRQAEDRCHRLGQTRDVRIIRLISKGTIEEGMLQIAQDKLRLERDISVDDSENKDKVKSRKDVAKLLKQALKVDL